MIPREIDEPTNPLAPSQKQRDSNSIPGHDAWRGIVKSGIGTLHESAMNPEPFDQAAISAISQLSANDIDLRKLFIALDFQIAYSNANLILATTFNGISGALMYVRQPGLYFAIGIFDFDNVAAGGGIAIGQIYSHGLQTNGFEAHMHEAAGRATVAVMTTRLCAPGDDLQLVAKKTAAGGTLQADQGHTMIAAIRIGA